MQYQLIPQILLTSTGAVSNKDGAPQEIHLRQGSADGACGAYSVMMTLLILGQLDYEQVTALSRLDRRTRPGRLQTGLEKYPGLFQQGLDGHDISVLLHNFNQVLATEEEKQPENCWQFILDHLEQDHPVIIGLQCDGFGHWMVIVGTETDTKGKVTRLLALDSTANAPDVCPWNAFITPRKNKRQLFPMEWHSGGITRNTRLDEAVAVWLRA